MSGARGWLVTLAVVAAACSAPSPLPTTGAQPTAGPATAASSGALRSELDVDPASFPFDARPDLVARIAKSPHAFFRYIAVPFDDAACRRLGPTSSPLVHLHGDAHVEQYAVSELGRGLYDYDDASIGPAVVDLARLGTSLILASRQLGGAGRAREAALLDSLLGGYADGLAGLELPPVPPPFAVALSAHAPADRAALLAEADGSMLQLEEGDLAFVRGELASYAASVSSGPPRSPEFFTVKRAGRLKSGIGSALVRKFLSRIEGPTSSDSDDVIVEVKEVADLRRSSCLQGVAAGAAERRAELQRRAARRDLLPPRLCADGRHWLAEWLVGYREAKIDELRGERDLLDLAREGGLWLAEEHRRARPDGSTPTAQSLALPPALRDQLVATIEDLADATTTGWEHFARDAAAARTNQ